MQRKFYEAISVVLRKDDKLLTIYLFLEVLLKKIMNFIYICTYY